MSYDNTNKGSIFRNDKKTNDKQPDYRGKINVDGIDKEISLWLKTSQGGMKFFSVQISEPYKKPDEMSPVSDELKTDDDGFPF